MSNNALKIIIFTVMSSVILLPVIALGSLTNLMALGTITESQNSDIYLYEGPNIDEDRYDFGNCTWWVAYLKILEKHPIPNNWGNAIYWVANAKLAGYIVNHEPEIGSIMQDSNAPGGEGHVAYVTNVDIGASWTISEMNRVGFDEVNSRILPWSEVVKYNFIHASDVQNL